ncbi:MAG: glucose-6-phosphate dehydrogenase [Chlamydiales bacterium]
MTEFFENPLEESDTMSKVPDPCVLVIFGATGDLTARKLIPALYNLALEGRLPPHFACVGFARREKSHEEFREEMRQAVDEHSRSQPINQNIWKDFSEALFYHRSEFDHDEGYESLKAFLSNLDEKFGTKGNRAFYFSTPPKYFPIITSQLSKHQLIYPLDHPENCWSRVIIEKPFGHDLKSAQELQKHLEKHMDESQVYRIDHYLGKETVQNLLVFRFSNSIFESLWNNRHIDQVQITVAEDIGIGTRGHFFEEAGILRDIIQNHMMQLVTLVAMEPPANLLPKSIHDEKVKVLESIRPIPRNKYHEQVVRGQYGRGFIEGEEVVAYREENDVSPQSEVETYMAIQLFIENWRWGGVPFYLRAGKRLPKRVTEIAIFFKEAPGVLFKEHGQHHESNALIIRIQPNEGISLRTNCKVPGLTQPIQPVKMDFSFGTYFGLTPPEAYERLICDCMSGDTTLFARSDEVLASWRLFTPILEFWEETSPLNFPNYDSGTWGPVEADQMIHKNHRKWRML